MLLDPEDLLIAQAGDDLKWVTADIELASLDGPHRISAEIVPRTDGVWAVHPTQYVPGEKRPKRQRWTVTHVPSGFALYKGFRSRQEAIDVAVWTWHFAVDKEGLKDECAESAVAASGVAVRRRFSRNGILTKYERGEPGGKPKRVETLPNENHFSIAQRRLLTEMKIVEDHKKRLDRREGELAEFREHVRVQYNRFQIERSDFRAEQQRQHEEHARAQAELEDNRRDLEETRWSILNALRQIDYDAHTETAPGRRLRKVKIRGTTINDNMQEVDQNGVLVDADEVPY